jgi:hypothetical protein
MLDERDFEVSQQRRLRCAGLDRFPSGMYSSTRYDQVDLHWENRNFSRGSKAKLPQTIERTSKINQPGVSGTESGKAATTFPSPD